MERHYHLLIIDPQNDFCDLPPPAAPALPVPGAHQDMLRLASLIEQGGAGLSAITITLDSHHRYDVAHPTFWRTADGAAPGPFTQISAADVRAGRFVPRDAGGLPRVLSYLDALESAGRYQLMVWPVHCEIGSWGHTSTMRCALPTMPGKRAAMPWWPRSARVPIRGPSTIPRDGRGARPKRPGLATESRTDRQPVPCRCHLHHRRSGQSLREGDHRTHCGPYRSAQAGAGHRLHEPCDRL